MNYLKRSDGTQVTRATVETTPNVQTNHRIWGFLENQFLVFLGAQKNFFEPPKPYLASEIPEKIFWGPQKQKKINFLKKPNFCDLSKHWGWFPQWPW